MKDIRIDIISVPADDQTAITAVQQKINQWLTKQELKKYEMHTTSTHIVFNIARKKNS